MSNAGIINIQGDGTVVVSTLTGNDGVVVPPTGSNINIVGLGVSSSGISTAPNLYLTGNAGTSTLTIHDTQAQFITNYTTVNHAASPYTVLATAYYLACDPVAGTISILLPNAPTTNRIFIVKDSTGHATANNITITTVGGVVTIDGSTTNVISTNYGFVQLVFNGTSYEVF